MFRDAGAQEICWWCGDHKDKIIPRPERLDEWRDLKAQSRAQKLPFDQVTTKPYNARARLKAGINRYRYSWLKCLSIYKSSVTTQTGLSIVSFHMWLLQHFYHARSANACVVMQTCVEISLHTTTRRLSTHLETALHISNSDYPHTNWDTVAQLSTHFCNNNSPIASCDSDLLICFYDTDILKGKKLCAQQLAHHMNY